MKVHIYRNRPDDFRDDRYFCTPCGGWYGVPHDDNHCQQRRPAMWNPEFCACRFCRESQGAPVEGDYGWFTESAAWQP